MVKSTNKKLRARKRFGQHFLTNGRTADRIVRCAAIAPDDTVLEIGPGKGILTGRLLEAAGSVTAVEIDRDLIELLEDRFSGVKNLRIVEADILSTELKALFSGIKNKVKVVSNIPYNISKPIIEMLIRNRELVSEAVLMVQKEVAGRLTAEPGSKDYGLTTLNLALCAQCRKVMDVKPGSFSPPPKVDSSVIRITFDEEYRYPLSDERIFREITGAAFRQRRKMIRNTMIPCMLSKGLSETDAKKILGEAGIDLKSRPERVGVSAFVTASNGVSSLLKASRGGEKMR